MSSSPPPPPSFGPLRATMPWYFVAAMVLSWLIGIRGLFEALSTLLFLRDARLPDVEVLLRELPASKEPMAALAQLSVLMWERMVGLDGAVWGPLAAARFVLFAFLVITAGMAMSGRPGSNRLVMQALLGNALFAVVSFWVSRQTRYAWADAMVSARLLVPERHFPSPNFEAMVWERMSSQKFWLWVQRFWPFVFDVGALLLSATTLLSAHTRGFFEAVERASGANEEP